MYTKECTMKLQIMLFATIFLVLLPVNLSALVPNALTINLTLPKNNDQPKVAQELLQGKPHSRDFLLMASSIEDSNEPDETDPRNMYYSRSSLSSKKSNDAGVDNKVPGYVRLYYFIFLQPYIDENVLKQQKGVYHTEANVLNRGKADLNRYKEIVKSMVSDEVQIPNKETNYARPHFKFEPAYNDIVTRNVFDQKQYSSIPKQEKSGPTDVKSDTETSKFKGKHLGAIELNEKRTDILKLNRNYPKTFNFRLNEKHHSEAFELNAEKSLISKLKNDSKNNDTAMYASLSAKPFNGEESNNEVNKDSEAPLKTAFSLNRRHMSDPEEKFRGFFYMTLKGDKNTQQNGKEHTATQQNGKQYMANYYKYFLEQPDEYAEDTTKNTHGLEHEESREIERFQLNDPKGSRTSGKWMGDVHNTGRELTTYFKISDHADKHTRFSKQKREVQTAMQAERKKHGNGNVKGDIRDQRPLSNITKGGGTTTEMPTHNSYTTGREKMSNSTIRGQIPAEDTSSKKSKENDSSIVMSNNGPKRTSTLAEVLSNNNPKQHGFSEWKISNNGPEGDGTASKKPNIPDDRKFGNLHMRRNESSNKDTKSTMTENISAERIGMEKIPNNDPNVGEITNTSEVTMQFHHNPITPDKVINSMGDVNGKNAFTKSDLNNSNSFSPTQSTAHPKEHLNIKMGHWKRDENTTAGKITVENALGRTKMIGVTALGNTDNHSIIEGKIAEVMHSEAANDGWKIQNHNGTTANTLQTIPNGSSVETQTVDKTFSNNTNNDSFTKRELLGEIPRITLDLENYKRTTEQSEIINESSTVGKEAVMPEKMHQIDNLSIAAEQREPNYRKSENHPFNTTVTQETLVFNVSTVDESEIANQTTLNDNNGNTTAGSDLKDISTTEIQTRLNLATKEPTEIGNGNITTQETVISENLHHTHNHSEAGERNGNEATYRANESHKFNETIMYEAQVTTEIPTQKTVIPLHHADNPLAKEKKGEEIYRTNVDHKSNQTITDETQDVNISSTDETEIDSEELLNEHDERNSTGELIIEASTQVTEVEMTTEKSQTHNNTVTEENLRPMDDQPLVEGPRMKRGILLAPKQILGTNVRGTAETEIANQEKIHDERNVTGDKTNLQKLIVAEQIQTVNENSSLKTAVHEFIKNHTVQVRTQTDIHNQQENAVTRKPMQTLNKSRIDGTDRANQTMHKYTDDKSSSVENKTFETSLLKGILSMETKNTAWRDTVTGQENPENEIRKKRTTVRRSVLDYTKKPFNENKTVISGASKDATESEIKRRITTAHPKNIPKISEHSGIKRYDGIHTTFVDNGVHVLVTHRNRPALGQRKETMGNKQLVFSF